MGHAPSASRCSRCLCPLLSSELQELRAEVSGLRARVRALEGQVSAAELHVRDAERDAGWRSFTVAQYNILAAYLGDNRQPWFLYGLDVGEERRAAVIKKFYERSAAGGYANEGWPRYVEGVLSKEEQQVVEEYHERFFAWEVRGELLRKELRQLDADVFSLVELDEYEAVRGWLPEHDSIFEKRPRSRSRDGCGIFWRRSKFEVKASRGIAFVDSIDAQGGLVQDRCGLMVALRFKRAHHASSGKELVVVSTHLARNPENSKMTLMRAKQVTQLARSLTDFAEEHGLMAAPVLLLGDMNAKDYGEISGIAQSIFHVCGEQVHPFFWQADDIKTGPTSVTSSRNVRIDVVLFQPIHLKVLGVVAEQAVQGQIPDALHPSDHIPIRVRFQVKADHRKSFTRANLWLQSMLGEKVVEPLAGDELRDAFDFFDYDRSGQIELSELEISCSALNTMLNKHQQETLMKCFPKERITFKDFATAYEIQFEVCRRRSVENLSKAFRFFDVNGDGALSYEEFQTAVLQLLPVHVDEPQIQHVWDSIEHNEDGHVDIASFCQEMTKPSTMYKAAALAPRRHTSYQNLEANLRTFRAANENWRRPGLWQRSNSGSTDGTPATRRGGSDASPLCPETTPGTGPGSPDASPLLPGTPSPGSRR